MNEDDILLETTGEELSEPIIDYTSEIIMPSDDAEIYEMVAWNCIYIFLVILASFTVVYVLEKIMRFLPRLFKE